MQILIKAQFKASFFLKMTGLEPVTLFSKPPDMVRRVSVVLSQLSYIFNLIIITYLCCYSTGLYTSSRNYRRA